MPKVDIWSRLTPQSQAAVEKSRQLYAEFKPASSEPLAMMREGYNHERRYWNSFQVDLPSVRDLRLDTPAGRVPLRLYQPVPGDALPVLLYSHGGGFILGNLDTHDRICRLLAKKSGWADLDGLDDDDSAMYRDHYIARPEDHNHPRNNLLKSDLAGLPPTFIGAVSYDPLRDDSLLLADFMKERGVPHRLKLYEGVLHGFLHYSALEPKAMQALDDGAAFLRTLT